MDALVLSGPGARWDLELLYSLRSLHQYAEVGRVFVVGYKFWWMRDVVHVPIGEVGGAPNRSTFNKLRHVVFNEPISERFLHWHDDFYLQQPFEERLQHRTRPGIGHSVFRKAMEAARKQIGRDDVLDFELHVPVVLSRSQCQWVIKDVKDPNVAFRTVYFNRFTGPSTAIDDVKISSWAVPPSHQPCFSIADNVGGDRRFQEWVRDRYPHPSPWERPGVQ